MDTWTDEHARLVAAAAPSVDDPELDRVWARVAAEVGGLPAVARRRRPVRLVVGAGVAAIVLGASGVAAAGFISARTGHGPSDAESLRLGGPGEQLDPAGADFRDVLEEETTDIPFPDETARQVSIDEHVRDLHGRAGAPGTEGVSTGALRGWTAIHAVCSWANEWVVTGRHDDAARHDEAGRMLVEARTWPAITDLDPVQETRMVEQAVFERDGSTTVEIIPDPTQFYYLRLVAAAVEADDVAGLGTALAENAYCIGPALVPDFKRALPPGFGGR